MPAIVAKPPSAASLEDDDREAVHEHALRLQRALSVRLDDVIGRHAPGVDRAIPVSSGARVQQWMECARRHCEHDVQVRLAGRNPGEREAEDGGGGIAPLRLTEGDAVPNDVCARLSLAAAREEAPAHEARMP